MVGVESLTMKLRTAVIIIVTVITPIWWMAWKMRGLGDDIGTIDTKLCIYNQGMLQLKDDFVASMKDVGVQGNAIRDRGIKNEGDIKHMKETIEKYIMVMTREQNRSTRNN